MKGDPCSAACVDSRLQVDLRGLLRLLQGPGRGGSSPASPSCVREPGAPWGEHAAIRCLHPLECKPVSLLTTTELLVSYADVSLLMQFIRFQVSDIRDALVSVYKVVPKVQCFLLEKVRYATLCHPLCLYQEDTCSLLRARAHLGVPRGRVVCVWRGWGCVQVYKCVGARVYACFEITGCCLTPCWAGWCSGSFSLTGGSCSRRWRDRDGALWAYHAVFTCLVLSAVVSCPASRCIVISSDSC